MGFSGQSTEVGWHFLFKDLPNQVESSSPVSLALQGGFLTLWIIGGKPLETVIEDKCMDTTGKGGRNQEIEVCVYITDAMYKINN